MDHEHSHNLGTLSRNEIISAIQAELVIINPFNKDYLGVNSYDVCLGKWFFREQHPLTTSPIYNIYDDESVDRVWGYAEEAPTYQKLMEHGTLPGGMRSVSPDDRVIVIAPGETILAHTIEFIGGCVKDPIGVTANMHARSSIGRSFLAVCKCAGYGDAGYFNRWTMEITNFSKWHWIPLIIGRRIAQMSFHFLATVDSEYSTKGKYQQASGLREIMNTWHPRMMLPRLHTEYEPV